MLFNNKIIYRNPAEIYLLSLNSPVGVRNSRKLINRMCEFLQVGSTISCFDWSTLSYSKLLELKVHYQSAGLNSGTINTYLANIKGVAKQAWLLKLIATDDYLHIKEMKRIKYEMQPTGKSLTGNELKKLVNHCQSVGGFIGIRNAAMIALSYGAGLRVHELAKLTIKDYNGRSVTFIGKGRKQRTQPLPSFVITKLNKWLILRGDAAGGLFLRVYKSNRLSDNALSYGSIGKIFKRVGYNQDFSPHDLRRSFATNLLDSGVDVFTVRNLMGHANINTTMRYDMRGEKTKLDAVLLLPF